VKTIFIGLAVATFIVATLSGCAKFTAARSGIAQHGATAADASLDIAKWQTCTAASIGSLERDLGGDKERILGWLLWCGKKPANSPLLMLPSEPEAHPQSGYPLAGPHMKEATW
jgi:hypothetical protein